MLHSRGVVEITAERPIHAESPTLLDVSEGKADDSSSDSSSGDASGAPQEAPDMSGEIQMALGLVSEEEFSAALDILNRCYRAQPDDNYLRHLVLQAESGYLQSARTGDLSPSRIPVPRSTEIDPADSRLQPTEQFLLTMLDGRTDIKSLSWVAPLREVDLLRALEHMRDLELIELRESDGAPEDEDAPVQAVQWSPF
jgi:hypothetical protein